MKKIAVSVFLILLLITLAYLRRPDLSTHQQRLLAHAALLTGGETAASPAAQLPPLDFHDLYLITTTSDPQTGKMISFGFGHYIKILHNGWGEEALSATTATPSDR